MTVKVARQLNLYTQNRKPNTAQLTRKKEITLVCFQMVIPEGGMGYIRSWYVCHYTTERYNQLISQQDFGENQ